MQLPLEDAVKAFFSRLQTYKVTVEHSTIEACLKRSVGFAKGILLSNAFGKQDLIYILEKYLEDTPETSGFFLAVATSMALPDVCKYVLAKAREELDDTGTAKLLEATDIEADFMDLYDNGFDPGLETDWNQFNDLFRAQKRQLCVVTGMGGTGKSTWLENYLVRLAMYHNWKFLFYSPENFPVQYHVEKLVSMYIGRPFNRGMSERMTREQAYQGLKWVNEHFFFISSDDNATLDVILNVFKREIDARKIDGVIIDPWNTVEHKRPENQPETEYICECLTRCLSFTRRKNIVMFIVAHPAKMRRDKDGEFPPPTPYDISGSAHWANRPDSALTVYRHKDGTTHVIVNKMRFRMYGKNGTVRFAFDRPSNKYTEIMEGTDELPI